MLERTVSFWKRLLGQPARQEAAASVALEEDRRVWVRYPADLETTYRPDDGSGQRLSAHVRDISLGGVNLVVDREFTPGDLLSVELPGMAEQTLYSVLACVVHVTANEGGTWSLGCTFSRELNSQDLEAFGARRVRPDPPDQRSWMRFPGDVRATYHQVSEGEAPPRMAHVLDVSACGVGLLVNEPVENGTLLSVELRPAHGGFRRTMLACVVHRTDQANGDFALGCNFIRSLNEEELIALRKDEPE